MRGRFTSPHLRKGFGGTLLIGFVVFAAVVLLGLYGPGIMARADAERHYYRPEIVRREASRYFPNCSAAHSAGVYTIRRDAPGYRPQLDRDNDGLACEPH